MRYSKDHKAQTRQQLLQETGSHAKQYGFAASGVTALAGAAGLTTGSLYKHFDNKNALFAELVTAEMAQTLKRYDGIEPGDTSGMQKALCTYLSMNHVRGAASGCPVPSLAAEVARSSDDVRSAFEAGVVDLKNTLSDLTGSDSAAWTMLAQNVGAVMIARALLCDATRRELLDAVRLTGSQLLLNGAKQEHEPE
jgi:TetR/AcrR family transcriptional regulator, transcriptional repressor for nem operon